MSPRYFARAVALGLALCAGHVCAGTSPAEAAHIAPRQYVGDWDFAKALASIEELKEFLKLGKEEKEDRRPKPKPGDDAFNANSAAAIVQMLGLRQWAYKESGAPVEPYPDTIAISTIPGRSEGSCAFLADFPNVPAKVAPAMCCFSAWEGDVPNVRRRDISDTVQRLLNQYYKGCTEPQISKAAFRDNDTAIDFEGAVNETNGKFVSLTNKPLMMESKCGAKSGCWFGPNKSWCCALQDGSSKLPVREG